PRPSPSPNRWPSPESCPSSSSSRRCRSPAPPCHHVSCPSPSSSSCRPSRSSCRTPPPSTPPPPRPQSWCSCLPLLESSDLATSSGNIRTEASASAILSSRAQRGICCSTNRNSLLLTQR